MSRPFFLLCRMQKPRFAREIVPWAHIFCCRTNSTEYVPGTVPLFQETTKCALGTYFLLSYKFYGILRNMYGSTFSRNYFFKKRSKTAAPTLSCHAILTAIDPLFQDLNPRPAYA
jgi:hypothetical protein